MAERANDRSHPSAPERAPERDRETLLLDLLAGWLEYVQGARELGELPEDEFEAEYFEDDAPDPGVRPRWREHYDEGYEAELQRLNDLAAEVFLGEDEEGAPMTPAEFMEAHVLPFLRWRGEG